MKKGFWAKKVAGFVLIGFAAIAIFTAIVMNLWNAILVPVLHVGFVTFWQALGILLLSKILFSGFKGGGPMGGRGRYWKQEMRDKWGGMSEDERERMKQQWKQKCSGWKSNRFENAGGNQTSTEKV